MLEAKNTINKQGTTNFHVMLKNKYEKHVTKTNV